MKMSKSDKKRAVVFHKIRGNMTVLMLNVKLKKFAEQHPGFDVFYDGDANAIVGIEKEGSR